MRIINLGRHSGAGIPDSALRPSDPFYALDPFAQSNKPGILACNESEGAAAAAGSPVA